MYFLDYVVVFYMIHCLFEVRFIIKEKLIKFQ